jgi:hypothetical protein
MHLLPPYDESLVAYKDFRAVLSPQQSEQVYASNGAVIALDGRIVGTWRREFAREAVALALQPFEALSDEQHQALAAVASRYGTFHNMRVDVAYL